MNERRLNMRDLSLQPRAESNSVPFSPERDITHADRVHIWAAYGKLRSLSDSFERIHMLKNMKVLGIDISGETSTPEFCELIEDVSTRAADDVSEEWTELEALKIIDPTLDIPFTSFATSIPDLAEARESKDWTGLANYYYMFQLFGLEAKPTLEDERLLQTALQDARQLNNATGTVNTRVARELLLELLVYMKLLHVPHEPATRSEWTCFKRELALHRKEGAYDEFAGYARQMTILAASDVQVTEKGIELSVHEEVKKEQDVEPLPPVRQLP